MSSTSVRTYASAEGRRHAAFPCGMISQEYGQAYSQELSWPGGALGGLNDDRLLA